MQKSSESTLRSILGVFFLLVLVGLTLAALSVYAKESDRNPQKPIQLVREPEASEALIRLFTESSQLKPFIVANNRQPGIAITSPHCTAWIFNRPEAKTFPPTKNFRNRIRCSFQQNQIPGTVTLSLGEQEISTWGSRGEKSVSFKGDLAKPLYLALDAAHQANQNDPLYFWISPVCTLNGSFCNESAGIAQNRTENAYGALICSREWTWKKDHFIDGNYACVIIDPPTQSKE